MKERNLAILAKLCWRLASDNGSPWAAMLSAKYLTPKRMTEEGKKLPCSSIWAACKKGGPIYVKGLKWAVRSGETTKFWLDFWLPEGTLRSLIQGPFQRGEENMTVRQFFVDENDGRTFNMSFELPDQLLNVIKATPLSLERNAEDVLHWAYSKNGFFSLKSAYLLARGLNPMNRDTDSIGWVWKVETPPKVHFFLWLCLHNSIPVGEVLGSRGLNLDPTCSLCSKEIESVEHLVRGCEVARNFWNELKVPYCMKNTFNLPIENWLKSNCRSEANSLFLGIPWKIVLPMGVWYLWLHRNNYIFKSGKVEHTWFRKCIKECAEFYAIGCKTKVERNRAVIPVGWSKPPEGWSKLNTDGSVMGSTALAGGGGVIRGHEGEWITGFARPLGRTNSCMAELWALRDGLLLAKELNLNNLVVELDALSVVLLMRNNTCNLLMEPLLTDCRNLLKAIPNTQVVHAYREANQCADALAKMGATSLTSFVVFVNPPPVVDSILALDSANVFCNRIVCF